MGYIYSPWNSPGQNTGVGSLSLLQGIFSTQGSKFFTSQATGKPKNTGVSSLSPLQRVFWTQESNRDLLHCRRILYQLSYQGTPKLKGKGKTKKKIKAQISHFLYLIVQNLVTGPNFVAKEARKCPFYLGILQPSIYLN